MFELFARHHDVYHTVFQLELGGLEVGRRLDYLRLLRYSLTGEPDERTRLGNDYITDRSIACQHPRHCGVGEHTDIGHARFVQFGSGSASLRHLHQ